jgi:hypothetical protein
VSANRQLNWKIPEQVSRGRTPDISHILMFYWFEPVLYLDPVSKFPETTEKPGYFVGFVNNIGDALTFKVLKNDLSTIKHRSVVRSAADASHRNRRVTFKPDVQEQINKLDTKPGFTNNDNLPKYKSKSVHNDVSSRARSKANNSDQRIGISTKSKLKNIYTLSAQSVLFPLHDVFPLNSHERPKNENLQSCIMECKTYHDALMNSKSRNDFDRLRNLHTLDMIEEDDDKS